MSLIKKPDANHLHRNKLMEQKVYTTKEDETSIEAIERYNKVVSYFFKNYTEEFEDYLECKKEDFLQHSDISVSEKEIQAIEDKYNIIFPQDYKAYVLRYGGTKFKGRPQEWFMEQFYAYEILSPNLVAPLMEKLTSDRIDSESRTEIDQLLRNKSESTKNKIFDSLNKRCFVFFIEDYMVGPQLYWFDKQTNMSVGSYFYGNSASYFENPNDVVATKKTFNQLVCNAVNNAIEDFFEVCFDEVIDEDEEENLQEIFLTIQS